MVYWQQTLNGHGYAMAINYAAFFAIQVAIQIIPLLLNCSFKFIYYNTYLKVMGMAWLTCSCTYIEAMVKLHALGHHCQGIIMTSVLWRCAQILSIRNLHQQGISHEPSNPWAQKSLLESIWWFNKWRYHLPGTCKLEMNICIDHGATLYVYGVAVTFAPPRGSGLGTRLKG